MGKFSSILLGTISGAAVAVFLTSKKGKEVTARVADFIKDVQENPEDFRDQVVQSATNFTNQAVDTVSQVKEKVSKGEITTDTVVTSVKEKTQQVVDFSQDKFQDIKDKLAQDKVTTDDLLTSIKEQAQSLEEKVSTEEIVIDLEEDQAEKPAEDIEKS